MLFEGKSPQLKDMWQSHPGLKERIWPATVVERYNKGGRLVDDAGNPSSSPCAHVAFKGWQFVPLVVRARRWICELKITFLRRHDPGDIVQGGDIDNRLKTLFDGLRLPTCADEISRVRNEGEDELVFCLLDDDALITSVSIETERLWGPVDNSLSEADVDISLRVTVKKYNRDLGLV